jgi:pantetheine-phosphate adenylyltransferase
MKTSAIYALSADPITYGHIDIIERAAKMFEEVVVAIGENPVKNYLFSKDEKKQMIERSIVHLSNVRVVSFSGMLCHLAEQEKIFVNIKGIRNFSDYEYEFTLHTINFKQNNKIESVYFPAKNELQHVSSGAAKAILIAGGNIDEYVPVFVKEKMIEKLTLKVNC